MYYVQIYTQEEDEKEVDKVREERREMSEPDAAIRLESELTVHTPYMLRLPANRGMGSKH